jgi:SAM-dependent methyltransferase
VATIPPEPEPEPERQVRLESHQYRQIAESFGVDPERYDQTRPRYPAALVERIVAASPGPDVLDVGCGTGIAARQFQAAGCRVLGVEPDARMADFARRTGIGVEVATFEAWDGAGRVFDAVVAGQAWHWVDPLAGAAKAAGVLRPGGLLAPFWHVFDPPPEVADAVAAVYQRLVPDSPFNLPAGPAQADRNAMLFTTKAADGIRAAGGFGDPERWRYDWERSYTREEWLDQLATSGALTRLPPDKLAEVLEAVAVTLDAMASSITVHLTTVATVAARALPLVSDPAAGPLRLIQSFANTIGPVDLLRTREEAAAWLRAEGLLPAEAGLTNSEHAALLRLREAVRDVLAARADGREDAAAAARLTRALAEGRLVVAVDPAGTVRLASAARASYPGVVAAIAVGIWHALGLPRGRPGRR